MGASKLNKAILAGAALLMRHALLAQATVEANKYVEWTDHPAIYTNHSFPEQTVDLGEVQMNYATAGCPSNPPLLLIPGQAESWWGYEEAMWLLKDSYQVFAVDVRGQGRSTWTPGRYSLDNFGNDLVRFIDTVIQRPVVVCGLSSGGVQAAWMSAFAKPGQVIAAVYEDPPLFASEVTPAVGHSIRQTAAGPQLTLWSKWIGAQWTIGDLTGMAAAASKELPAWLANLAATTNASSLTGAKLPLQEYDPEFGDAFVRNRVALTCDHEAMLTHVKVPVLFTHHFHAIDPSSGNLLGALSDQQVQHVQELVLSTGNNFTYVSLPTQPHDMHSSDPATYVTTITNWFSELGIGPALSPNATQVAAAAAKVSGASSSVTARSARSSNRFNLAS